MKRKFISVLLALVLVLSFSLLTAVPATSAPSAPVAVSFEISAAPVTAKWSTAKAGETGAMGDYSAELHAGFAGDDWAEVVIIPPTGITLDDMATITSGWSWWYFIASVDFGIRGTSLELHFEGPNQGYAEMTIMDDAYGAFPADPPTLDAWTEFIVVSSTTTGLVFGTTDAGGNIPEYPVGHEGTIADLVAHMITQDVNAGAWELVEVRPALGWIGASETTAYIDNVTFDGVTYELEPRVINTDTSEGFNTIQDAIDDADTVGGHTISVAAGTYVEQVVIDKSLTLQGGGSDITVIKSPASLTKTTWTHDGRDFYPIIEVNGASAHAITVHVSGFTIDGDYNFDVGELGETKAFTGIVYRNADGSIQNNEVKKFRDEPLSTYQYGEGIWVIPGSTVTVANNDIHNYNKTGIRVSGVGAEATVTGNTVTGYGPTDVIAQNGVLLIGSATGTVSNNTVTSHSYTPQPQSSGVLIFLAGSGVKVQDNPTLDSNDIGIAVYYSDNATVRGNTISSNAVGVDIYDDDASTADTIQVNYNNITTNSVYGVYNEGGLGTVDATNNWWGDPSGPSDQGTGTGDAVSANVDYIPWLGAAYPGGLPVYPAYIGTTGYDTIQEAVTAALSGQTVTVTPGTYVGDITISENLTLVSSGGAEVTKLEGTGSNPVVTIGDYTVVLEGFEIDPGTDGVNIPIISAGNVVTIENLVIYDNTQQGIDVGTVYGTLNILNNIIADNSWEGIFINEVDDGIVVIKGNVVGAWEDADYAFDGNSYEGIYLEYVYNGSTVTIGGVTEAEANLICDNISEGIYVDELYYGSTLTIEGNAIGAYAYDGYTFDGNDYGVYVDYVDYGSTVTIRGNAISENTYQGIYIDYIGYDTYADDGSPETEAEYYALFQTYGANTVTIEGNWVGAWEYDGHSFGGNGDEGIEVYYMDFASTLTIQNNVLSENYDGMYIAYYGYEGDVFYNNPETYPDFFGPVVLVKGNTITDNEDCGIYCDEYDYGTSVTIEDNIISGNWEAGIYHCCGPYDGSSIIIRGNTITNNDVDEYGYGNIYNSDGVYDGSTYIIENNLIAGSTYYGVYIYYVEYNSSLIIRGNTIGAGSDAEGNLYGGNYYEAIYIDYVSYDSTAEITRNNISGNQDDAIYIYEIRYGSSVSITRNNIKDNEYYAVEIDWLYADGNSVDVHYNNIVGNDSGGIYHNDYSADFIPIDATHNWWGVDIYDDSGPYHSSYNPDGQGDEVSYYVTFSPWLSSPAVWAIKAELITGWNTLSTPIALDSASDELAELTLDMEIAFGFYGGAWVLITDDNDTLEPCDAFYVKMNSGATVDLVPNPEQTDPPEKELSQRWNLVGLANLSAMAAEDALASAYLVSGDLSGFAQVVSPSVNGVTWSAVRGPAIDTALGYDMLPCKGYWVFMTNAGTLAGFTFTPIQLH